MVTEGGGGVYNTVLTNHAFTQYRKRGGRDNFKKLNNKLYGRFNSQIYSEGIRTTPREAPNTYWIDLGGGFYAVMALGSISFICVTVVLNGDYGKKNA